MKLSAASTNIVANGASTDTVTATAVDASGNTVSNFNGTATVAYATGSSTNAVSLPSTTTVTFKNGVATFDVTAGTTVGETDQVTLTGLPSGVTVAPVSVTSVAQKATSVVVTTAPTGNYATPGSVYLNSASSGNMDTISAYVADQEGQPMLSGSYPINFTVTGSATISNTSAVFNGDQYAGNPIYATTTLSSQQGQSGTIEITGSSTGLTSSQPLQITEKVAGAGTQFALNHTSLSLASDATTAATVAAQIEDASGVATTSSDTANLVVNITDSTGANVNSDFTVSVNSQAVAATGLAQALNTLSNGQANISILPVSSKAVAGSYTITISTSDNSLPAKTIPLTVTASTTATQLSVTAPSTVMMSDLPSASQAGYSVNVTAGSTNTVNLQLQDAAGNPVAESGAIIVVYPSSSSGTVTLNGSTSYGSSTPLELVTNASGKASFTFSLPLGASTQFYINDATDTLGSWGTAGNTSPTFTANNNGYPVNSASMQVFSGTTATNSVQAGSGNLFTTNVTLSNSVNSNVYGNGDYVLLTLPSGVQFPTTGTGATDTSAWAGAQLVASSNSKDATYNANLGSGQYIVMVTSAHPLLTGSTTTHTSFQFNAYGSTAGAQQIQVQDISVLPAVSSSQYIVVSGNGVLSGFQVQDGSGDNLASNSSNDNIQFQPNQATEVWVKAVDSAGNPVVLASPQTVTVSLGAQTGNIETVQGGYGAVSQQVTIPAGSSSVPVWVVNGSATPQYLNVTIAGASATLSTGTTSVTGSTYTVPFTLTAPGQTIDYNNMGVLVNYGSGAPQLYTYSTTAGTGKFTVGTNSVTNQTYVQFSSTTAPVSATLSYPNATAQTVTF